MKLGNRNLFYSLLLAAVMLVFLVGYFVYMLPSLYVEYAMEQNLKSVKEQHSAYAAGGSYASVAVRNPTACFSVRIPDEGDSIFFSSKMVSAEIKLTDERIKKVYAQIRDVMKAYGDNVENLDMDSAEEEIGRQTEAWGKELAEVFAGKETLPFAVDILERGEMQGQWYGEYQKVHAVSDRFAVFEMGVESADTKYINYIALERTGDSILFTFLPVLMPDMNEIRPVVLQSLPMLGAVILLLVLLFSQVYSRGIVTPIVRLVRHTERMKRNPRLLLSENQGEKNSQNMRRHDEIGTLSATIDGLYEEIQKSYEELAAKNEALAEENRRQEVLLKASSHQLKTPISAALLLVDGMKNRIGRYQDTETYLPKVKEQLLSMRKMVEDILYLNHCRDRLDFQELAPSVIVERQLAACRIAAAEKQLTVTVRLEESGICTDETVFSYILANLLSNAVNYTPCGSRIEVAADEESLSIRNYGAHIDEELLPHIFEPFVRGQEEQGAGGHGLGLYIAAYYTKQIGMHIRLENGEDCVSATLFYEKDGGK